MMPRRHTDEAMLSAPMTDSCTSGLTNISLSARPIRLIWGGDIALANLRLRGAATRGAWPPARLPLLLWVITGASNPQAFESEEGRAQVSKTTESHVSYSGLVLIVYLEPTLRVTQLLIVVKIMSGWLRDPYFLLKAALSLCWAQLECAPEVWCQDSWYEIPVSCTEYQV